MWAFFDRSLTVVYLAKANMELKTYPKQVIFVDDVWMGVRIQYPYVVGVER